MYIQSLEITFIPYLHLLYKNTLDQIPRLRLHVETIKAAGDVIS